MTRYGSYRTTTPRSTPHCPIDLYLLLLVFPRILLHIFRNYLLYVAFLETYFIHVNWTSCCTKRVLRCKCCDSLTWFAEINDCIHYHWNYSPRKYLNSFSKRDLFYQGLLQSPIVDNCPYSHQLKYLNEVPWILRETNWNCSRKNTQAGTSRRGHKKKEYGSVLQILHVPALSSVLDSPINLTVGVMRLLNVSPCFCFVTSVFSLNRCCNLLKLCPDAMTPRLLLLANLFLLSCSSLVRFYPCFMFPNLFFAFHSCRNRLVIT